MRQIARSTTGILSLLLAPALLLLAVAQIRPMRNEKVAAQHMVPPSAGLPTLGLTMADFTGDGNPDLATVTPDGFESPGAQYLVEISLTEGGHQFLRLTAPFGQLEITSKDLTGDGNLDLVVSIARSREPAAVFLNDGHGHFSPAEPGAFARSLREDVPRPEVTADHFYFGATPISCESYPLRSHDMSDRTSPEYDLSFIPANHLILPIADLFFGPDRAPPTAV